MATTHEHAAHHHASHSDAEKRKASQTLYQDAMKLPSVQKMYDQIGAAILRKADFKPEETQMMDFACGSGVLSLRLAKHCKRIVGVDISQGMVDAYNTTMQVDGVVNAQAVCAELRPDVEESQLKGEKFDIILCAHAYHHIKDTVGMTRVLKSHLKPNGVLLVLDPIKGKEQMPQALPEFGEVVQKFIAQFNIPEAQGANIGHMKGSTEDEMKSMFDTAGIQGFEYEEAFVAENENAKFATFVAKGTNA
ncbi:hypothetical protein M422DRAFT_244832 [Sphaerobolus stellatus SS14]|nr:hypothetical protein M422DRAFT_244832 [Sphaerobolus stellatus SS14]